MAQDLDGDWSQIYDNSQWLLDDESGQLFSDDSLAQFSIYFPDEAGLSHNTTTCLDYASPSRSTRKRGSSISFELVAIRIG
jgi:hypothetical protein